MTEKLTPKQFQDRQKEEWMDFFDIDEARKQHAKNIKACQKAVNEYEQPLSNRPLRILAVHGSSRSVWGGANETSNSMLFLQKSLEVVEGMKDVEVTEIKLGEKIINPCNNCVSTTSGMCGFPCDCWPYDDMQTIYPELLRSDVLLCSTGVNQATMSSRMKLMVDRMISLDGGYHRTKEQFRMKDSEFKGILLKQAKEEQVVYDQRLYGRSAAYFISSKDHFNTHKTVNHLKSDGALDKVPYGELVAWVMKDGMESYGYFHDEQYYALAASDPDIEYMYDKETLLNNAQALNEGAMVVEKAVKKAKDLKENLPAFTPDRINRT